MHALLCFLGMLKYKQVIIMIETRLLEYFLVLSHQKNISQAAKSLYISQSTLSKQMMELEEN